MSCPPPLLLLPPLPLSLPPSLPPRDHCNDVVAQERCRLSGNCGGGGALALTDRARLRRPAPFPLLPSAAAAGESTTTDSSMAAAGGFNCLDGTPSIKPPIVSTPPPNTQAQQEKAPASPKHKSHKARHAHAERSRQTRTRRKNHTGPENTNTERQTRTSTGEEKSDQNNNHEEERRSHAKQSRDVKGQSPTTLALLLRIPAPRQPGETKRGECLRARISKPRRLRTSIPDRQPGETKRGECLRARISCHVGCPRQRRPGETKSRSGGKGAPGPRWSHQGLSQPCETKREDCPKARSPAPRWLQSLPHLAAVRNKAENLETVLSHVGYSPTPAQPCETKPRTTSPRPRWLFPRRILSGKGETKTSKTPN
ncbi:hypothetical protein V501_06651 [Pseudogymnoascus sp. VKM F-4519 (FW-2642)]|nr:hypothetical protein V501_06651 [Pseudogymnoascus sp. VKM F-4519 (FW-2642)]